jgi:nitrate/nitrite transporter NarK
MIFMPPGWMSEGGSYMAYGGGTIWIGLVVGFLAMAIIFFVGFWILMKNIQELRLKVASIEERVDRVDKNVSEIVEQLREI